MSQCCFQARKDKQSESGSSDRATFRRKNGARFYLQHVESKGAAWKTTLSTLRTITAVLARLACCSWPLPNPDCVHYAECERVKCEETKPEKGKRKKMRRKKRPKTKNEWDVFDITIVVPSPMYVIFPRKRPHSSSNTAPQFPAFLFLEFSLLLGVLKVVLFPYFSTKQKKKEYFFKVLYLT